MTAALDWPIATDVPTRKLSADERAHYDEHGFVEVQQVFSADEIAYMNAEIDRIRNEQAEKVSETFIFALGLRSPATQAICRDERLLTLIEDIVKPGIAIYSAKLQEKLPNTDFVCHWHQDNSYYNKNSTSECRMSIWIPLQQATEENGCLWVVPGSHKQGQREFEQMEDGSCALAFAKAHEHVEGEVPYPMEAGNVLLFDAYLWHASRGNRSNQSRRSFIVSYQEATCAGGNGDQHKILRPA